MDADMDADMDVNIRAGIAPGTPPALGDEPVMMIVIHAMSVARSTISPHGHNPDR